MTFKDNYDHGVIPKEDEDYKKADIIIKKLMNDNLNYLIKEYQDQEKPLTVRMITHIMIHVIAGMSFDYCLNFPDGNVQQAVLQSIINDFNDHLAKTINRIIDENV